jgi:hypothetical protein
MGRQRRFVSYLMLFVFGVLLIKGLFAGTFADDNCDEFAHIHIQKTYKSTAKALIMKADKTQSHGDKDDECHEGKSIFAYSTTPAQGFDFSVPKFAIVHKMIFALENHFQSPFIEPHRKPPKYS